MNAASNSVGTALGLQFAATLQFPPAKLVQTISAAWIGWAERRARESPWTSLACFMA
jgi:hypothetical protein